jgi:hypothetical protein
MPNHFIKTIFLSILGFALYSQSYSQEKVEQSIQLMTSELIGAITTDIDELGKWLAKVNEVMKEVAMEEPDQMELVAFATLSRNDGLDLQLAADPPLKGAKRKELMEAIQKIPAPTVKYAPFSVALISTVNGGLMEEAKFYPPFVNPLVKRLQAFEKLDLEAKDKYIRAWAKDEIAPIFAYYTGIVEADFKGVLSVGKLLAEQKYLKQSVDQLTTQNPDYWRAVMEMSPGNQLIPYSKVIMHLVNGEYDQAEKMLFFLSFFSDKETLPAQVHDELNDMTKAMKTHINREVQKGIELHDQGKFKAAVKHYDALLKTFPNSAWLQYERYFSYNETLKDEDKSKAAWENAKPLIYGADPLYPMDIRASTGREAYLLFRRQEVGSLFKSRDDLKKDLINYADIALDLGVYGYGAQLYWMINLYFDEEDYGKRDMMAHYYYCLDKLGNKEILSFMEDKDSYPKKFAKIEKERRQLMEESLFYKSFEKSE